MISRRNLKELQQLSGFTEWQTTKASNQTKQGQISINKELKGVEMNSKTKIGIVICDRYRRCAGGKCFRAMKNREGAFSTYRDTDVELVRYTTCDGCPGGHLEYAGE